MLRAGREWDGSGTSETEVGRKWDGSGTEVGREWHGSGTEVGRKWHGGPVPRLATGGRAPREEAAHAAKDSPRVQSSGWAPPPGVCNLRKIASPNR